jgi:hypothetical protein
MDIERIFAAEVCRAEREAAKASAAGCAATASDHGIALADLWAVGRALGLDKDRIAAVRDKNVAYDKIGDPRPRPFDHRKVAALRR